MYYTVIKHDGHLRTRGKCCGSCFLHFSSVRSFVILLFRPGSLIAEFKVGVQDSQAKLMIAKAKKLLKTFSKFDQNYFAVKDPQG